MLGSRLSAPLALATAALLALSGCGDADEGSLGSAAAPSSSPSAATSPQQSPQECPLKASTVAPPAGASKDLKTKPTVAGSTAPAPRDVQVADIVVGSGAEATTLSKVETKYVGAFYETGKEFDSSWSRGPEDTLPFTVCAQGVVPGFSIAPTGMKVGGRRQVTIPAEFAYGAEGSPPTIPGGATLVFVIDLVKVGS
ncbi:MAG: Peptidylprolyl isomerase [Frankiales bacterium]|jgi:FKBP-type peptidyl-prolyl cis-trans isomerase|nr:Peptidylprolyl isomerase [Frankiales bacterium]